VCGDAVLPMTGLKVIIAGDYSLWWWGKLLLENNKRDNEDMLIYPYIPRFTPIG
jgi:hypothetical protein